MSNPLHSERVHVDVEELLTDIQELEIDIALPIAPTASLIAKNDNTDVTQTRDLSRYNQHLASDSSDDEEDDAEEKEVGIEDSKEDMASKLESDESRIGKIHFDDFDANEEDIEEGNEEQFSNEYIALEDDPDDQFSEFVSAPAESSTEIITSTTFTTSSTVSANAPYDLYAPRAVSNTTSEEEQKTPVDSQDIAEEIPATTTSSAVPNIQPLTKERIDIIRGTMLGLDFAKRPGSEAAFSNINLSKLRLGDEVSNDKSK